MKVARKTERELCVQCKKRPFAATFRNRLFCARCFARRFTFIDDAAVRSTVAACRAIEWEAQRDLERFFKRELRRVRGMES